jgi:Sec-independent protein secretion pathway component TatC
MSFIEHLEELRRRLIWSLVFVAIAFAGCWVFAGDLIDIANSAGQRGLRRIPRRRSRSLGS